jgi:hypothetical protein
VDDVKVDEKESEKGTQSKGGRGWCFVYDLEVPSVVDINARGCNPYPPITDEIVVDEDYKCEEPEIVRKRLKVLFT